MHDDDHFDDWLRHNRDAVVRYAYLLCGDRDLSEELVADAVARLWPRHRGRIDNLDGYVRRTIANRLTDRRRRTRVRQRYLERFGPDHLVPSSAADEADDRLALWPLVLALPPKQRAVVVLRFYEGRPEADIASLLDISPGTVKSRFSPALDSLRDRLALQEARHG